jgi:tetratricopeptide (TPR) repeat protein
LPKLKKNAAKALQEKKNILLHLKILGEIMAKKTTKAEENIQAVEQALSKSERFIVENQNPILIILGVLVFLVLAFFGFQRFYIQPNEERAKVEMFAAQNYLAIDSLNLALNGDGINYGFLDIIDNFRFTKSARLAHYYAGTIYLKKGEHQKAIDHFKKFRTKDNLLRPMALGAIGDAYVEMGDLTNAANYYLQAAKAGDNEFTSPVFLMKAAWTYELMEDYARALQIYRQITKDFPQSTEARELDRNIARAEGMLKR